MKPTEPVPAPPEPVAEKPKARPKKAPGMTRKGFGELIKRAFTPDPPKPR